MKLKNPFKKKDPYDYDDDDLILKGKEEKKSLFKKSVSQTKEAIQSEPVNIEKFSYVDPDKISEDTEEQLAKAQQEFKKQYNFKVTTNSFITEIIFFVLLIVMIVIMSSIIKVKTVSGNGMSPFLKENSVVFINDLRYKKHAPERGDLISCNNIAARVIGLSGETISFYSGKIYIDNIPVQEKYLSSYTKTWCFEDKTFTVPENSVFVLFDNRKNPINTKDMIIPIGNIDGKIIEKL